MYQCRVKIKISWILLLISCGLCVIQSQDIPEHLRECYNNSIFENRLPMNIRVLVDIIRKAEQYSHSTLNLRTMSSSLLHRFKVDGIEHHEDIRITNDVLPFSASGFQRAKQKLIEELVPGNAQIFPFETLSLAEQCSLHYAVSNTIITRDSQSNTCQQIGQTEKLTGKTILPDTRDCPREYGVILTPYGTVAPGAIIGAIAASLQHQNVNLTQLLTIPNVSYSETVTTQTNVEYNDEVDLIIPKSQMTHVRSMWHHSLINSPLKIGNIWLTTIAGELAEMVVYQGPVIGSQMTLGATGFWNNTMRPSVYYLTNQQENFEATRAEIIGGIDGLIIAENLNTWIEGFYSLRLSQILDMYYTNRGIAFNPSIRACDRGNHFLHVVPRTILEEQTYAISHILAYRNGIAYISPEALKRLVDYSVNKFSMYAKDHLFSEVLCRNEKRKFHVETIIAFDGAWSKEYTADFISVLIEDLDVSMYGSKMGIIHGFSGEVLLNITNSPSLAYQTISNFTNISWPLRLNFTRTLETVFTYLNTTWEQKQNEYVIGNLGQAVVFLSPLSHVTDEEKESVLKLLQLIKHHHPDVHFLYYTSEYNTPFFKTLILSEEDHIIKTSNIDDITQYLSTVPRVLRPMTPSPNASREIKYQFEDYISPLQSITYRLHPNSRINTKRIIVTIHSFEYGTIKLCSWYQYTNEGQRTAVHCKELSGNREYILPDSIKCTNELCPSTYYAIDHVSSTFKCTEIDCESPDQIRYIIRIQTVYGNSANGNVLLIGPLILYLFLLILL